MLRTSLSWNGLPRPPRPRPLGSPARDVEVTWSSGPRSPVTGRANVELTDLATGGSDAVLATTCRGATARTRAGRCRSRRMADLGVRAAVAGRRRRHRHRPGPVGRRAPGVRAPAGRDRHADRCASCLRSSCSATSPRRTPARLPARTRCCGRGRCRSGPRGPPAGPVGRDTFQARRATLRAGPGLPARPRCTPYATSSARAWAPVRATRRTWPAR